MDMIVPEGMYGTLMSSVTQINYNNLAPGETIAVDMADVVTLTKLGFVPVGPDEDAPTVPPPVEFDESLPPAPPEQN